MRRAAFVIAAAVLAGCTVGRDYQRPAVYQELEHGMRTTHHDVINADLLSFFKA